MSGFFLVTDVPNRRVVQYKRVTGVHEGTVFIADESVLGAPVDEMPFADKTGIALASAGVLFEVPYLPDAGDVYFATQPEDAKAGDVLTATAKAGTKPYAYQWYKDDQKVINAPNVAGKLTVSEHGNYWCVVTDAEGNQAVSQAVTIEPLTKDIE